MLKYRKLFVVALVVSLFAGIGVADAARVPKSSTLSIATSSIMVSAKIVDGVIEDVVLPDGHAPLLAADVISASFRSDRTGWEDPIARSVFRRGRAVIRNIANNDLGKLTLETRFGEVFEIDLDKWVRTGRIASSIQEFSDKGKLLMYGTYEPMNIGFDSAGIATVRWESNILAGLDLENFTMRVINPRMVSWVGWGSAANGGVSDECTVKGRLFRSRSGNYSVELKGIDFSLPGTIFLRLRDKRFVELKPHGLWAFFALGATVYTNSWSNEITVDFQTPEPRPMSIAFNGDGTANLDWGYPIQFGGFVTDVDPGQVDWIGWASNETGWGENCQARGNLNLNPDGTWGAYVSGIPSIDHPGIFFVRMADGTIVFQNIEGGWAYSVVGGSCTIDTVNDLLQLHFDNSAVRRMTFRSDHTLLIEWEGTELTGLVNNTGGPVTLDMVAWVGWGSNIAGWGDSTQSRGVLATDPSTGRLQTLVSSLPIRQDTGNPFMMLNDGSVVYLNVADGWQYEAIGGSVSVDTVSGNITYLFTP